MPSEFDTEDFKALQAEWAQKLRDSGFDDLENDQGQLRGQLDTHTRAWADREAIGAYFDAAWARLHNETFDRPDEQDAWELHCQGKSYRQIGAAFGRSRMWAARLVQKYGQRFRLMPLKKK